MADSKISALPASTTPLAGTELVPIVQSGATKKVSVADLTAGRAVAMASLNAGSGAAIANTVATLGNNTGSPSKWGLVSLENCGGVAPPSAAGFMVGWNYSNGGGETNIVYGTGVGGAPAMVITAYNGTTLIEAGRFSATGNYVPAAAKGINFTANTPAAGMTSQLLNWYEEGTWTPVAVPAAGAITTQLSSGTYTRVGNVVTASFYLSITNAGTATNLDFVSGLPYAAQNTENMGSGCIREFNSTGKTWNFTLLQNATQMFCRVYDNSSTIASGYAWRGSVTYHV